MGQLGLNAKVRTHNLSCVFDLYLFVPRTPFQLDNIGGLFPRWPGRAPQLPQAGGEGEAPAPASPPRAPAATSDAPDPFGSMSGGESDSAGSRPPSPLPEEPEVRSRTREHEGWGRVGFADFQCCVEWDPFQAMKLGI